MQMTVNVEKYVVKQNMHLGPLRRELQTESIIEWQPETGIMKINGTRVDRDTGVDAEGAMQMLRSLSSKNPANPPIEPLGTNTGEISSSEPLQTSTLCVLPILGCLQKAKEKVEEKGIQSQLAFDNEHQEKFIEMFGDLIQGVSDIPEVESRVEDTAAPINEWLAEHGFDITLSDPSLPDGFVAASILDILLTWLHEGSRTSIQNGDGEWSGIHMSRGLTVAEEPSVHPYPVARIRTKGDDTVGITPLDEMPCGLTGLFLKVADLEKVKALSHTYDKVSFPMIDLNCYPDLWWMTNLKVGSYFIEDMKQQTKFRMNEQGARLQSAAGTTMVTASLDVEKDTYVVNKPFLLWITREGMDFPVFAAVLCEDSWSEPDNL